MMETVPFWLSFFKMLAALALVLGLLVGGMYFLGRIMQRTSAGANDSGVINIVAARYLGPKSSIMLVEILDNFIVIGLANNQISHLGAISSPEALEKLRYIKKEEKRYPPWAEYLKTHPLAQNIRNRWGKSGREQ